MKFTRKTFSNGLRAIVAPMEATEAVTVLVFIGTGANYETRRQNGISHFLEHMFFKGTKNYPKPGELGRMLDAVGAQHNAFTSREETGYWIKSDVRHFPLALMFVSEILQNALLDKTEIDRERGVILEEMNMYWDNPRRYIWDVFESLLYGDHPYGWNIIGPAANIQRLPRSAFVEYWKKQYVASNAVVIVAGNVSPSHTFAKIEKAFGALRLGKPHKAPEPPKRKGGKRITVLHKDTAQTHILIGGEGYRLTHKDRQAAGLLATILGGYSSSRLFTEIRERLGLAYTVYAAHTAYKYTGFFSAYAGVPHGKTDEVVSRIVTNFSRIKKNGVTAEELSRAKEHTRGSLALSLESTDEVASFLGEQEILLSKILGPADIMKKVDAVTRDDVRRVARAMFRPASSGLALVGPHTRSELYEKILNDL